jgi:hypothetical protein
MSLYLARLKHIDNVNFINSPQTEMTEPTKASFGTFGTSHMGIIIKNKCMDEVVSNWWLIHFTDQESLQVAIWPPCNYEEALALNPQAIAAEPIPSPIAEVITNE